MFENLIKAVSLGKSIEGLAGKSPIVQDLMQRYLGVTQREEVPRQEAPRQITDEHATAAVVDAR